MNLRAADTHSADPAQWSHHPAAADEWTDRPPPQGQGQRWQQGALWSRPSWWQTWPPPYTARVCPVVLHAECCADVQRWLHIRQEELHVNIYYVSNLHEMHISSPLWIWSNNNKKTLPKEETASPSPLKINKAPQEWSCLYCLFLFKSCACGLISWRCSSEAKEWPSTETVHQRAFHYRLWLLQMTMIWKWYIIIYIQVRKLPDVTLTVNTCLSHGYVKAHLFITNNTSLSMEFFSLSKLCKIYHTRRDCSVDPHTHGSLILT